MGFYSFVVQAPGEIVLEKQRVILERGMNAFNALIDDLDAFLAHLKTEGATITKWYRLDEHESVPPQPELLTDEGQAIPILPTRGDDRP